MKAYKVTMQNNALQFKEGRKVKAEVTGRADDTFRASFGGLCCDYASRDEAVSRCIVFLIGCSLDTCIKINGVHFREWARKNIDTATLDTWLEGVA